MGEEKYKDINALVYHSLIPTIKQEITAPDETLLYLFNHASNFKHEQIDEYFRKISQLCQQFIHAREKLLDLFYGCLLISYVS